MRATGFSILMTAAVLVASSKSFAAAPGIECEGNSELYVCLSIPGEAPAASVEEQAPIQESMKADLVSEFELSGEAADYTVLAGEPLPHTYDGTIVTFEPDRALLAAKTANDKIKQVENYLHAGVQTGNEVVSISGSKK